MELSYLFIRIFILLKTVEVSLDLHFLLIRLLHLNNFCNGASNVDLLAILNEHLRLELTICQHIFNVQLQLVAHINEILINLADAILEVINVLVNTYVNLS
jgi:hypothetical protein